MQIIPRRFWLFVLIFFAASPAFATPSMVELEAMINANHAEHQNTLNHMWTMIAAALVMLMQVGFLLLEAGMVRSKNSINVAQKNIVDFVVAILLFYAAGFAIMFGSTYGGWFGWSNELSFTRTASTEWHYTFFIFQAVFVGTAATIVSGAVAERMKFSSYMWVTVLLAGLVYPVAGHWGWGNLLNPENETLLSRMGFLDFAGSTIVHSVGGWAALATCLVLGPRIGRFDKSTGKATRMEGHSLVLSTTGCLLLWIGWIGFNGGSTNVGSPEFAQIIFNTVVASVFGGIVAIVVGRLHNGFYRPDQAINGILAGLVAVTAGCNIVDAWGAAVIGGSAALIMHFGWIALVRSFQLDDVVGAVPVHALCGAWGTLILPFFAMRGALGDVGVFAQFLVQLQGVGLVFVWTFGTIFGFCKVYDAAFGIRVTAEEELEGLNVAEHRAVLGTGILQQRLADLVEGERDLTKRVMMEPGDEASDVAEYVNRFIDDIQSLMRDISKEAERLQTQSLSMNKISSQLASSSEEMSQNASVVSDNNAQATQEAARISSLVSEMNGRISSILQGTNDLAQSMNMVSHAVEEMTTFSAGVAEKSSSAADVASKADILAERASDTVSALGDAAKSIGDVVALIKSIASQTNLLALNATIEASAAGEFGKGFAIVASEVKALAQQTAAATEEIEQRIGNIQLSSKDTASILSEITGVIGNISSSISAIKDISHEQSRTTNEVSKCITDAVTGTIGVRGTIEQLSTDANDIALGASQTAARANEVGENMKVLSGETLNSANRAQSTRDAAEDLMQISNQLSIAVQRYRS